MKRMGGIVGRYGSRTPFVVLSLAILRTSWARHVAYGIWLRLTTKGGKGKRIHFGRGVSITPGCDLVLGDDIYIGPRCIFEVSVNPPARVTVGDNVWISHDCHIGSYHRVDIGAHVLVGEFVSIRDTSHRFTDPNVPIQRQEDVRGAITIESDVWIGRGAAILGKPEGTIIGRGAVIGANSVISSSVPRYAVVAGSPARQIRNRRPG